MNDTKFSIIITKADYSQKTDYAFDQVFKNFEYFFIDNNAKTINDTISKATGDYIIFINSEDTFIPNALANIARMIYLTNSDLIKFGKTNNLNQTTSNVHARDFQYLFLKNDIMEYAFSDLSEFCIKKDIVKNLDFNLPRHILTLNVLMSAKDITQTDDIYIYSRRPAPLISETDEYIHIADWYLKNSNISNEQFWKKYFMTIIPLMVKDTTIQNNKDVFNNVIKKIPLRLIPLKYKFIFFIMKTCI